MHFLKIHLYPTHCDLELINSVTNDNKITIIYCTNVIHKTMHNFCRSKLLNISPIALYFTHRTNLYTEVLQYLCQGHF